jgi:hypothetical protein
MTEPAQRIYRLDTLLNDTEKMLLEVVSQTTQLPLPIDLSAGVEHTAYVHEFVQRARAWQLETERLRQILSDHPALAVTPPSPDVSQAHSTRDDVTRQLDMHHTRMVLTDGWMHQSPVAFTHRGKVYALSRPSFREMYRHILHDLSQTFTETFIMRCQVARHTGQLAMTDQAHVYNYATFRYAEYYFNIQLPADTIRRNIRMLYDAFALPVQGFVVWVKG